MALADSSGDQLRVLCAEIHDQHGAGAVTVAEAARADAKIVAVTVAEAARNVARIVAWIVAWIGR